MTLARDFEDFVKLLNKHKVAYMEVGEYLSYPIKPERPEELGSNETFEDGNGGILFTGTKGKMMASEYAANPSLLPPTRNNEVHVKQTYARVPKCRRALCTVGGGCYCGLWK